MSYPTVTGLSAAAKPLSPKEKLRALAKRFGPSVALTMVFGPAGFVIAEALRKRKQVRAAVRRRK